MKNLCNENNNFWKLSRFFDKNFVTMKPSLLAPNYQDSPYWWDVPAASLADIEIPRKVDVAIVGSGYTGLMRPYRPCERDWRLWFWTPNRQDGEGVPAMGAGQHQHKA
ncbi:MAG: hypothetical protein Ct9H300mP28_07980 [Pseudomonadota bacterium]|nr:MAG: hypothetical protein Ct9H300mP28_07980 [Pseudomonadota bacterium]